MSRLIQKLPSYKLPAQEASIGSGSKAELVVSAASGAGFSRVAPIFSGSDSKKQLDLKESLEVARAGSGSKELVGERRGDSSA